MQAAPFKGLAMKTPEEFSFEPTDWPVYKRKVERWFKISEAKEPADQEKINTGLLYMEWLPYSCILFSPDHLLFYFFSPD
jgi:hypothetical protein